MLIKLKSTILFLCCLLVIGLTFPERMSGAQPNAVILSLRTISQQPEYYHGWPTLARRANGELVATWSGRRLHHVCPFGTVEMMLSRDDGQTWSFPQTLLDSPIDDRDSGVLETARGTLLVTTFTSLAYERLLQQEKYASQSSWQNAQRRLPDTKTREAELGEWAIRSEDGGKSWSARIPTIVNSPHGPILLQNGTLFYAGKQLWTAEKKIGIAVSDNDGQSWEWFSEIPARPGDSVRDYHELHAVECTSGKIVVQIRNHNSQHRGETLQTESVDGGLNWSTPHSIGVWGLPSHLLKLKEGQLMMTYGHRRQPYGNQARLSTDEGVTWSAPMTISDDGANGDLGYPSTVQLNDGSFLTLWYEQQADSPRAVLRLAHWKMTD